jgi:predicted nucleic-acid-binding Zn-ribbon protein
MSNLLREGIRNTKKCPKCGSLAKQELYSVSYAIYRPQVYDENGFLVSNDNPNGYIMYQCRNCGEEYKDVE